MYTITDAGREFLTAGQSEEEGDPRRGGFRAGPLGRLPARPPDSEWAEMGALVQELREFGMLFVSVWRSTMRDTEKRSQLRDLVQRMREELLKIAGQGARARKTSCQALSFEC